MYMKIKQIKVENYRLLKSLSVDLQDDLSVIIGKNNVGKTSFLSILEKFLSGGNNFSFNDFNLDFQTQLKGIIESKITLTEFKGCAKSISLKIYIEYLPNDNLGKISSLIMNLEPTDNILVLSFEYILSFEKYEQLIQDFAEYKKTIHDKDSLYFLSKNHKEYFKIIKKSLEFNNEDNFIEIEDNVISKIINFKSISAKRGVANQDVGKSSDKTLSKLSANYYDYHNKPNGLGIIELQQQLTNADTELNKSYETIFKPIINTIKRFGSIHNDVELKIISNLEEKNILTENTFVTYNQGNHNLPEDYNGLGYMNLFAILFNIHLKVDSFRRITEDSEPAAINILFIEEPEAHTHPQMQYIFIKNIKQMLSEEISHPTNKENMLNLQTIITTHSSHIVSQSDFNDIKCFIKSNGLICSKNLAEIEAVYQDGDDKKRNFQFLKQYITLNKSEIFFADKVIFIEGDTERILLPSMMKKLDMENRNNFEYIPLLSQHISIVEVGAYAHIFEKLMDFIEIKTLIITDLDSIDINEKRTAVEVSNGNETSNASIKHYFKDIGFEALKSYTKEQKILKEGMVFIAFQAEQNNYHARSFEDSFIHLNRDFINKNKDNFNSLKNRKYLDDTNKNAYDLADNCIEKKTAFATEILYYGGENFENWHTPEYIKEGLVWL